MEAAAVPISPPVTPPHLPGVPPKPPIPNPILWPIVTGAVLFALAGDFLLWDHAPGLGLAILFALAPALLFALRGRAAWNRRTVLALALYLPACVQMAIEICFTNVAVLILLMCVLLGETNFVSLPAGGARWREGAIALMKAPFRWLWLGGQCAANSAARRPNGRTGGASFGRALRIAGPALLAGVIFTIIFANGNAIFSDGIARAWSGFARWIADFDISVPRVLFWLLLVTLGLALARPALPPVQPRSLTREPARFRAADPSMAALQSIAMLGMVNVIFCVVNTIDAGFLWMRGEVPAGVSPFDFIHAGANSLITATVLSAIILVAVFHQTGAVADRRSLKLLAMIWIAQNLVLLSSVALRLHLYLEVSNLHTAKRIHLACFLALVALGFVFLSLHILRRHSVGRLFFQNALAVFALFYGLQFINTTGIAARWNVNDWAANPAELLNMEYLGIQGENAWGQLVRVAESADAERPAVGVARQRMEQLAKSHPLPPEGRNWREIQTRRDGFVREIHRAAGSL